MNNHRSVKFKRFIKKVWVEVEGKNFKSPVSGTGCFEPEYTHKGTFWQWGLNTDEFEEGAASYSIALIELEDGSVEEVLPKNIKFENPTPFDE